MELTWFGNPYQGYAGTLSLCFNALDLQVIRGRAAEPAVISTAQTLDYARLLERVAALAGVLRTLGLGIGDAVEERLAEPFDRVLFLLAAARIGAVLGAPEPRLVATSDPEAEAPLRLVRGVPVRDEARDLDWDMALKAGREDPAACVELRGDAAAFMVGGQVVPMTEALEHPSWPGRVLAGLVAGGPIDLTGDVR